MAPDASLTPDVITAQTFTSAFRGYDPTEVKAFLNRVAGELRAWRERADNLESAWHSAEERAARPPVLDEDTLMAAVGEETAAILRTARAAAVDLRSKAADEAERTVTEARDQAERVTSSAQTEAELALAEARSEAERLLGEAREQAAVMLAEAERALGEARAVADAEAAALLAEAKLEASTTVERAQAEAEDARSEAEKERRLTIEGAQATRDRILEDLSRRRRVATVQIEQLRAGRERLAESYAVVRRTLEEVQSELSRADAEARAAADQVGRRLKDVAEPELTEDHRPAGRSDEALESDLAGTPLAGLVGSAVDELFARIRATSQPVTGEPQAEPEAGDEPPAEADPPAETDLAEPPADDAPTEVIELTVVEAEPPPADVTTEVPEVQSPEPVAATLPEDDAAATAVKGAVEPSSPSPPPARSRRRGKRGQAEASAAAPAPVAIPPVGATQHSHVTIKAPQAAQEAAIDDSEEGLLQRRDEAVSELEVVLTRRLKRALQDEQNDVLDRLRSLAGAATVDALLAPVAEQAARYADAARPLLADSASAGAEFASGVLGTTLGDLEVDVDDLARDCGNSVVGPLRRRLEQAIVSSAGEDQAVLVETIGAAYREWKTQRVERLAGDVLHAAFGRGTWQTVPEGTAIRWLVADLDGPCPDCDDDALAGAIAKGEPFPTGQPHPPAHSGCRCLLVPG